ncbi:hypothetical protein FCV63_00615 [Vibrio lentus]|uniref:hypothetical protein n=1 Tax=Vibrio TaxID=662 RepID=UPI000D3B6E16|nr:MULTISPECIES: hypothetical protein [Vibrio]PTO75013.1 hypothetical protein CWN84_15085 [Vibrio splendidus]TKF61493.1 hypothetical protein FCV63_00615 [Vibrio lentus]
MNFVMTLHQTDVGYGQTTPGTLPRSPEIFIPLAARNANQDFWGWPNEFSEDPEKANKFDRLNVPALLNGRPISINMMTWPDKSDFRLRCQNIREVASIGDILLITKTGSGYEVSVINSTNTAYQGLLASCSNPVHNSDKRWGYLN